MYLLQYRNYLFIPGYTTVIGYAVNTSINFITISYIEGFLALLFPPTLVIISSCALPFPHRKKMKQTKKTNKNVQDSTLKLTSPLCSGLKYKGYSNEDFHLLY